MKFAFTISVEAWIRDRSLWKFLDAGLHLYFTISSMGNLLPSIWSLFVGLRRKSSGWPVVSLCVCVCGGLCAPVHHGGRCVGSLIYQQSDDNTLSAGNGAGTKNSSGPFSVNLCSFYYRSGLTSLQNSAENLVGLNIRTFPSFLQCPCLIHFIRWFSNRFCPASFFPLLHFKTS